MFHFNKAGVQKQVYSIKVKKLLTMNRLPMFDFVQRSAMNTSYAKTFYWVKWGDTQLTQGDKTLTCKLPV